MDGFVPTKAVTVRVPVEVVNMLNTITRDTGQTHKQVIEAMIRASYKEMTGGSADGFAQKQVQE